MHTISMREQRGVGLVEVLIAVLVLCFGMLGIVGLQLVTLKNNQSSLERGVAVIQTHSIVDAMRADRSNAVTGAFNIGFDAAVPSGTSFANAALAAWRTNIQNLLGPDATGSIACDGADCWIRVRWNDSLAGGKTDEVIETQVQL
jgi:type IV pilus assembly protein PilV